MKLRAGFDFGQSRSPSGCSASPAPPRQRRLGSTHGSGASREEIAQGRVNAGGHERSIARTPEIGGIRATEARFQPLATLPDAAPPSYRRRWERLASQADKSYRAAVELKCLECCTWHRSEVKRCQIRSCPLWGTARRIFGSEAQP
jgi:hypothetical protein